MARGFSHEAGQVGQWAHPVYLDTQMLVSFLASLEDGVSYSSEVAERYAAVREGEGEGGGRVSLPSIATLLGLSLSAEGRYKRRSSKDEGVESKFVREHTAASLFNRLRLRLAETPGTVTQVDSADKLTEVEVGGLIEMCGEVTGNPLKQILDLLAAIGPYFGLEIDEAGPDSPAPKRTAPRNAKRGAGGRTSVPQLASMSGEQTPELTLPDLLRVLKREVERSPVLDLLMEGPGGVKAVLTVSRELLSPEVEAYLIGGQFTVLGKASALIESGRSISLLRRTVFGIGGRDFAEQMFGEFNKSVSQADGLDISLARAILDGPAIQILPLAVYL